MPAPRKRIWVDLLLYPAHTLPTAAAPVLVGAGLAAHDGVFAAGAVLLAFLGSWVIHVAGVFMDNHELLRRHPHVVEHPELSAAIADRSLTLGQVRFAIAGLLLLALPAAYCFLQTGGAPAIALGIVGVVASLGYAGGPAPYARLGLAEPVFFAMFGIAAVAGTYFAQVAWLRWGAGQPPPSFGELPITAFVVGLPVGALVTNVLLIDDLRDRAFDATKGWRTLAVRSGPRGSRAAFVGLTAFAYLAPLAMLTVPGFTARVLLPWLTLPAAVWLARAILASDDPATLLPMTPRASLLSCAFALLFAAGLA